MTITLSPETRDYLITNHGTANIFEHLYNHNLMLKVLYYLTAEDIKEVEVKTTDLEDRLQMWKYGTIINTHNKIISNYKKHIKEHKIYLGYETLKRLDLYFNPVRPFRNSDAVIKFLTNNPKVSDYNYELRKKRTTHLANKGMYYSFIKTIAEYRSKFIIEINDITNISSLKSLLQRSIGYIENSINIDDYEKFNHLYELLDTKIPNTFFKKVRISETYRYIDKPMPWKKNNQSIKTRITRLNKLLQYDNIYLNINHSDDYNVLTHIDDNYPVEKPILVKQQAHNIYKPLTIEKQAHNFDVIDVIDVKHLKKVIEAINKFNFDFCENTDNPEYTFVIKLSQNKLTNKVNNCIGLIKKSCIVKYDNQEQFEALIRHYEHIDYQRIVVYTPNPNSNIRVSRNGDLSTSLYLSVTLPEI